jgi:hypothetical protein
MDKKVPNARRVVVGSPSTPSDVYIKKLMKMEVNGRGSILSVSKLIEVL